VTRTRTKVERKTIILGAGITGLAAGFSSGFPIYERSQLPGGLCGSYYLRPGDPRRLRSPPADGEVYRFEFGGGHWLWGGDQLVHHFLKEFTPLKTYDRRASAYFADQNLLVPYPVQHHLKYFGAQVALRAAGEIARCRGEHGQTVTMADWFENHFGHTLNEMFFSPYHLRYTAGLSSSVAPQDASKSPLDLAHVRAGAHGTHQESAGYNAQFSYPIGGLDAVVGPLARVCQIHYGKEAVKILTKDRSIRFTDGSTLLWNNLISTLPLDRTMRLAGLSVDEEADPFTSVLVTNIGAKRGRGCPNEHWVYIVRSSCAFHRVGFYSNVDASFLPVSAQRTGRLVSLYVETAYPGGGKPKPAEVSALTAAIIAELRKWAWIEDTQIVDATWVETAYTWRRPASGWAERSLQVLNERGIHQVGRYGRWASTVGQQSIFNSIGEGLLAGAAFSVAR